MEESKQRSANDHQQLSFNSGCNNSNSGNVMESHVPFNSTGKKAVLEFLFHELTLSFVSVVHSPNQTQSPNQKAVVVPKMNGMIGYLAGNFDQANSFNQMDFGSTEKVLQNALESYFNDEMSFVDARSVFLSAFEALTNFNNGESRPNAKPMNDDIDGIVVDGASISNSGALIDILNRLRTIKTTEELPKNKFSAIKSRRQLDGVSTKKRTRPWSIKEDNRLLAGILRFGLFNWPSVSLFVGNNRSRGQCAQRWNRGLDPKISKDMWTSEEEMRLIKLVEENGQKSWSKVSCLMGNRSDVQCRYHFKQISRKNHPLLRPYIINDEISDAQRPLRSASASTSCEDETTSTEKTMTNKEIEKYEDETMKKMMTTGFIADSRKEENNELPVEEKKRRRGAATNDRASSGAASLPWRSTDIEQLPENTTNGRMPIFEHLSISDAVPLFRLTNGRKEHLEIDHNFDLFLKQFQT